MNGFDANGDSAFRICLYNSTTCAQLVGSLNSRNVACIGQAGVRAISVVDVKGNCP